MNDLKIFTVVLGIAWLVIVSIMAFDMYRILHPIIAEEYIPEVQVEEYIPEEPQATVLFYLTAPEQKLVEQVVAAEGRGESLRGQMAIANVILDRTTLWNQSIIDTLTAPGQFAHPYQGEISDTTKEAVRRVFIDGERIFEQPTTHFYAYELCDPYWAESKESRGTIGGHRYMY